MLNLLSSTRKINKGVPVPYYYQLAQILRDLIEDFNTTSGKDGEVIFPSEVELSEFFQLNRGTVRHALDILEREGLIYREKGRGTFLERRRVELDLTRLCSTTEDLKARGWEPGVRVISINLIQPQIHVQHHLRVSTEKLVWKINRLRLANGEPISLQWSYIPQEIAPDLDQCDLENSLYYSLKNVYGVELMTAEQIIRTRAATSEEAELLGVAEGDPLFDITRMTRDQNGKPVEHLDSLWRGDRYDLRVKMFGNGL